MKSYMAKSDSTGEFTDILKNYEDECGLASDVYKVLTALKTIQKCITI